VTLGEIIAVLERTPGVLRALLGGLDENWTHHGYGAETFSPYNVVGHLIIGERTDWIPRARIILEHGESLRFDPFDHRATIEPDDGPPLADLLDEFASLRASNLDTLRGMNLTKPDFERRGIHPALGPVTLGELLHTWACHDLHHLAQIAKGVAHQGGDGVGPWHEYIGILTAPPHPA